jgi:hypothetical protein
MEAQLIHYWMCNESRQRGRTCAPRDLEIWETEIYMLQEEIIANLSSPYPHPLHVATQLRKNPTCMHRPNTRSRVSELAIKWKPQISSRSRLEVWSLSPFRLAAVLKSREWILSNAKRLSGRCLTEIFLGEEECGSWQIAWRSNLHAVGDITFRWAFASHHLRLQSIVVLHKIMWTPEASLSIVPTTPYRVCTGDRCLSNTLKMKSSVPRGADWGCNPSRPKKSSKIDFVS